MEKEQLLQIARDCGFETVAELDVSTLKALPEVRDMCAVNTCGKYDACWSCPPGCGEIDECAAKMKQYAHGILVQTVGDIEDSLDFEGIMEVKESHDERYRECVGKLKEVIEDFLPLADGACTLCAKCSYPDEPCRFPDKSMSSMEAFGLYVSDVCKQNGVAYNYGPGKMCYSGCFLYND